MVSLTWGLIYIALSIFAIQVGYHSYKRWKRKRDVKPKLSKKDAVIKAEKLITVKLSSSKLSDLRKKEFEKRKKEIKEEYKNNGIFYQDAVLYNPITKNLPRWKRLTSSKHIKDWWNDRKHPDRTLLINMELNNGFHKLFQIKEERGSFKYKGNRYILDNDAKYYVIEARLWAMDYHESFTNPIKRKIPIVDIKKTLEQSNISEVEYASNPSTLERFIVARIAEGIMKGQALDDWMKKIQVFLIVTMIAAVIHLMLFIYGSGMLNNLSIPGLT